jgi:hypothetical protein
LRSDGTHIERYIGFVVDNNDPERAGRLTIQCDQLFGEDGTFAWVEPVFPFLASDGSKSIGGWFFVPDIGAAVEIEVNVSSPRDDTFALVSFEAPEYRWRDCPLLPGRTGGGGDAVADEFLTDSYPLRRGITTAVGHALVFDDVTREVKLQAATSDDGFTFLDFDPDGNAMILTSKGMSFYMNQKDGELSLIDTNQNVLMMNSDGWYVTSGASDMIKAGGGSISVFTANMLVKANSTSFNQSSQDSSVLVDGFPAPNSFHTKLQASLTEISAGLAAFGIPTTQTAALITLLAAGTYKAARLKSE